MPQNRPRGLEATRVVRQDRMPACHSAPATVWPGRTGTRPAVEGELVTHPGRLPRLEPFRPERRADRHGGLRRRSGRRRRGRPVAGARPMPAPSWPQACSRPGSARVRADHRQVVRAVRAGSRGTPGWRARRRGTGTARRPERPAGAAPAARTSGRSRPAPGWIRSGRVPGAGALDHRRTSADRRRRSPRSRRSRRRRPCAAPRAGSGSVTRMKPRRGRIGRCNAGERRRPRPTQVPAALTTAGAAIRPVGVRTATTRPSGTLDRR